LFPELAYLGTDWRFEYKYRLPFSLYTKVKAFITPYMRMDDYTLDTPQKRYLVRSLYLDSDQFTNYIEKVHGDSDRVKLRIRTYTNSPMKSSPLRAEFKARRGIAVEKHSTWITLADYKTFSSSRHWLEHDDPILIEFERYVHMKNLRPKIIVEYHREGYRSRSKDNLRITFDHQVHSAHSAQLYPPHPFFHEHYPGKIVLEIKCNDMQPPWLRRLVQEYGLRPCTNSKYVQGINIARKDIVTPSY